MNISKRVLLNMLGVIFLFGSIATPVFADNKKYDLRINPIAAPFGIIDAEANIKVHDNFTVAPMYTKWSGAGLVDVDYTGYGVRVYWHPSGVFMDGFYVSPFYRNMSVTMTVDNSFGNTAEGSFDMQRYGAIAGYLWQWDNFNLNFGVGYASTSSGDFTARDSFGNETTESTDDIPIGGLAMDFSLGFAF